MLRCLKEKRADSMVEGLELHHPAGQFSLDPSTESNIRCNLGAHCLLLAQIACREPLGNCMHLQVRSHKTPVRSSTFLN